MAFEQSFLDELEARNPIEDVVGQYVSLTRKGGNLFGLCPFHSEKTASFSVAPDKGIYYCFGCHKGGGPVNFIMEIESLSYPDAIRFLAKRAGMEVPEDESYRSQYRQQERLWALCKEAARWFRSQLMSEAGAPAREYLVKRALSAQTVTRFGLGFSPNEWGGLIDAMAKLGYTKQELLDAGLAVKGQKGGIYDRFRNRLMFPIIDIRGNIIGFGGRVMDDSTPKYLNSPETIIFNKRKNLFALNVAKKSKQGRIILTEGYMDAISLHQYGFDCAVASLGTSLTEEHANILAKYTNQVVLTYDGDEAGQNATRRAIPMLEKTGIQVKVLRMQGAKDPDEFLKKYGADRFALLLDASENQAEYQLESLRRKYDLTLDEQRVEFLSKAAALISSFPNAVQREIYGARAAEAAGISAEAMKIEVGKAYKRRRAVEQKKQEAANLTPAKQLQPKSRDIRYDNVRSALAEEGLLRMLLKEPELIPAVQLQPDSFSVPLFGRVFESLRMRHAGGSVVSLGALAGSFTPEEMAHLSMVANRENCTVSDEAVADYVKIIQNEHAKQAAEKDGDRLRQLAEEKRRIKGYGG
ncbi:MAG: DNA primase [Clostridia bacterium]|nr:DNA primase [Clostridia bacterium]